MNICKNCGKQTKNKFYCSRRCGNTDPDLIRSQKRKRKETFLNRYGVDNPLKVDAIKERAHNTCIERYGFKSPSKNIDVVNKQKEALRRRFQENRDSVIESFIREGYTVLTTPETYKNQIIEFICPNGHHHYILTYNWNNGHRCGMCEQTKVSIEETELAEFLSNYVTVKTSNKDLIWPYEIDIYIPEHNLAIEYNGLYWHSEKSGKPKNYHILKTLKCDKLGIRLIHIFDDEWNNKKSIVKSLLLSKLGIYSNRVYARNCDLREIDSKTKNRFLEENHIQGKDNSYIYTGLYHNNDLVSVMTFGKRKITGSPPIWEMLRFCSKINTQVVGGASKLFKYTINNYNIGEVISYADRRWSVGDLYSKLGFELQNKTKLNYWYTIDYKSRSHRSGYQKHLLGSKLNNFDSQLTEWQNMQSNGFDRVWDCGNYVFKLI